MVTNLFIELCKLNIKFKVSNGKLDVQAPKGVLNNEILDKIRSQKEELIALINSYETVENFSNSIPQVQSQADYPLSSSQKRFWLFSQFGANSAYNIQGTHLFQGSLSMDALNYAFKKLIERHEILRTVFKENELKEVKQNIITPELFQFSIIYEDLQNKEAIGKVLKERLKDLMFEQFDLSIGPLFRVGVFQISNDKWVFAYVMHHIISDGWSMMVVFKEIFQFYNSYIDNQEITLSPLQIQYKDYASWQQLQLENGNFDQSKKYWLNQLKGDLPILKILEDKKRPAIKTYNGNTILRKIDKEQTEKFKSLCNDQEATLFMGLLSLVNTLLYHHSNQDDIIIGSSIAGRENSNLENQIGFYVNTLALRTQFKGNYSFKKMLNCAKTVIIGAYDNQAYPFDELVEELKLHRDMSRNPLFDVMLALKINVENTFAEQRMGNLVVSPYVEDINETSKLDFSFNFDYSGTSLAFGLEYNTSIYEQNHAEQMADHLVSLVNAIIEKPTQEIQKLEYLSETEKQNLLVRFNDTTVKYPTDKDIIDLFEEQVTITPDKIALVFEEEKLSYKELNDKSNQLADYLKKNYKVKSDDLIGIALERNEWTIISILAVLKTGGAYVPIDPVYPKERKDFMLEDSGCRLVIDDKELKKIKSEILDYSIENLIITRTLQDLAYIIYTSGTTGKPKGVMIEHNSLLDYVLSFIEVFKIEENDKCIQQSSLSFDTHIEEIFPVLIKGGTLLMGRNEGRDVSELQKLIEDKEATILSTTPLVLNELNNSKLNLSNLRLVISGGDVFNTSYVNFFLNKVEVYNSYGPSESTVCSTYYKIDKEETLSIIGYPINNRKIYLLQNQNQLSPVGVTGEICIGGSGLARGYLNRPGLTAEKFTDNPFIPGERIYRTGDLGRWLPDGRIEFLGRSDDQLKLRGYRIELGEIENVLLNIPDIKEAVVVPYTADSVVSGLTCYFVSEQSYDTSALRTLLGNFLPVYMIPGYYVQLNRLPITSNGKVDKSSLPSPEGLGLASGVEFVAPRNEVEEKLAAIWQEVLGIERVGITDNFFELGGHSLMVAQVLNQTQKQLSKTISFKDFFANPSIAFLSKGLKGNDYVAIAQAPEQDSYPLTASQKRLWILSKLEGGSLAYNIPGAVKLKGDIDVTKFEESFIRLIARHEILRTSFKVNEQAELRQCILSEEQVNFSIALQDFSNQEKNKKVLVADYLHEQNRIAFDLEQAPLVRAGMVKLKEKEHIFFLSLHHIIGDGWSIEILLSEVVKIYNSLLEGKKPELPVLSIQYKDYAVWQNSEGQKEKQQASEAYWLGQFEGELPVINLPSFKIRPLVQTYNGNTIKHLFSKAFLNKIKDFSKQQDVTLFMTLLAGVNTLLHRYTLQDDIIIGTPIAGRENPDLESQLGLYLNTIAIRTQLKENISFVDLVQQEKETLLGAYEHQNYPFDELVGKLNLKRDTSRNALFDVMVVLQNQGRLNNINNKEELNSITISEYEFKRTASQFDISFNFVEQEGLSLSIEYNTDIYDEFLISRMFTHFASLTNSLIEEPGKPINQIDYLTKQEKYQLLQEFNGTEVDYRGDITVLDLFEAQVQKTPNTRAVVFEETELTYRQLNEKASQFGAYLRATYNINADDLIGIKLQRSEWMIVTILGILKSGAAYVPIDPTYPQERIEYIEQDINAKIVIDQKALDKFNKEKEKYSKENLKKIIRPQDLAYIIYTSGTAGNPKGVMIEHKNLVTRLLDEKKVLDIKSEVKTIQITNYVFDVSILEIFLPLMVGGELYIPSEQLFLQGDKTLDYIKRNKITVLQGTPSYFKSILQSSYTGTNEYVKNICVGGESFQEDLIALLKKIFTNAKINNHYGPTETTIDAIHNADVKEFKTNIIGKVFPNTQVYILDDDLHLLPVGVVGKLYISGAGVARGYLNKPELTAEKFIANPFVKGTRMYDTGDLGRWLPNGTIEFLGRKDNQVKIRGYRIELGEIETVISGYSQEVQQVVLEAKEVNQEKTLVAYYVSKSEIDKSKLRDYLQNKLPEYMVPSFYVELESLPLTPNGKVDRKALPSVTGEDVIKKEYIAPRNKEEQLIIDVWTLVLKQEMISVKDSFYNLGGDSIKSIQVVSRLKQKGYALKIENILRNPIVEDLAKLLQLDISDINQDIVEGPVILTPIQRYFFESDQIPNKNYYNQSVLLKSKESINDLLLKETIALLVKHHDALRMRYELIEGQWQQYNLDDSCDCFKISFFDLSESTNPEVELDRIGKELQSSFTLSSGVLFHVGHFRMADGDRLALIIHHLVVDGVSWRILLEDLSNVYEALENKSSVQLPLKTDSFQKWSSLQESYAKSDIQQQERAYWDTISQASIELLPKDFEDADNKAIIDKTLSFVLDTELTQKLQTEVHSLYNTEINDVLLTALALSIKETFSVERSVIKMEGHGREEIIDGVDIGRTIGWFTSVYPFVLDISDKRHPEIVSVKESLRKVPNKGIGYGILNYLDACFEKESSPSIQFNYLGDFGSNVDGKNDSRFEFSSQSIGSSVDDSNIENDVLLDVSGIMVSGKLSMSIKYSSKLFKQETIEKLTLSYKEQLCKLIKELSQTKVNRLTPSDLTFKSLNIEDLFRINSDNTIEDIYKLSPLQQGIYYHWSSEKSSSMYFEQTSYRIKTLDLDIQSLQESYDKLVLRYSVLRTSFIYNLSDYPLQIVRKRVPSQFSYQVAPQGIVPCDYVEEAKLKDREEGFDLETSFSQMRLQVVDLGCDQYEFIWSHHHILIDGWCMSILINDFYQILNSIRQKAPLNLPKPLPYSYYIQWLDKVKTNDSMTYWKGYLRSYDQVAGIPFKRVSTEDAIYKESKETLRIEADLYKKINSVCSQVGVTHNTFIQAVWGYLLSSYNNTQDVVFGSVVSGRPSELVGVENMIGLFINTIPVRVCYKEGDTPLDLLKQVHDGAISSNAHHYLNLSDVQSQSELGMNLLNHIMIFENYPVQDIIKGNIETTQSQKDQELSVESIEVFERTNYDFNILVIPTPESLIVELKYNVNRFETQLIKNMVTHIHNLVEQFSVNTDKPLNTLNYLPQAEKQQLLVEFNNTKVDYPKDKTIIDLFEEQVERTPNNVAVIFEEVELTYKELNEQSNQLGYYLRETYNIHANDLIGIKLDRSELMIVAILGILKSGAAYVPIDPSYPQERIDYLEKDSNCKVVIDTEVLKSFNELQERYLKSNMEKINTPQSLAYVIYTSGTTGNPKGVMIKHSNVVRLLKTDKVLFDFNPDDVWTMFHSYCFDFSVWEMYGALFNGSKLVVISLETARNPIAFLNVLIKERVTILNQTPSNFYNLLLEELNKLSSDLSLRFVIFGGEALNPLMLSGYVEKYPTTKLVNMYGITETTVHVTYKEITIKEIENNISNIGSPIPTLSCYVLDENQNLSPIGVPGELYVGGEGLAKGYLNRDDLTSEKFIKSPFVKGETLYRSGDIVRFLKNGELEYLGRKDHQVKIRGFRIELGEIETAISQYSEEIQQVIVEAKELNQDKALVAYYVSKNEIDKSELRSYLQSKIPEYMVPIFYVEMESFPLTPNGKVDRKSLPSVTGEDIIKKEYVGPRNEVEEKLVAIWQKILGRDKIGIKDDFFEIGGHSLNATNMLNKIRKEFDVEISFSQFFVNSKIFLISEYIIKKSNEEIREVPLFQKPTISEYENFSDQEYFDVFHQQEKEYMRRRILNVNNSYNMSFYVLFEKLDTYILEKVIQTIFERHESLRTSFSMKENILKQHITKNFSKIPIEYIDIVDEKNKDELITAIRQNASSIEFDLEKAPLANLRVVKYSEELSGLLFTLNHTISDDVSMRNLKNEIQTLYDAYSQGKNSPLAPIKFQYKDYAMWVNTFLKSEKWLESKKNYLSKISQSIERTKKENAQGKFISSRIQTKEVCSYRKNLTAELLQNLSNGKSIEQFEDAYGTIVNLVVDEGASYKMIIKEPLFSKLKDMASLNESSLFVNIISILSLVFYKSKDVKNTRMYIPFSTRVFEEFESIVGWLTSEIILPITVNESLLFKNFVEQVAKEVFENSNYRFYSYEKILNDTDAPLHLLAPVSFNFVVHNETELTNFDEGHRQNGSGHFDFKVEVTQYKNALNFNVEYNLNAYQASDIENIMNIYVGIIEILTENSNLLVSDIIGGKPISVDVLAN